ncbi:MAG: bifunctional aspartate kinase/homoserine dehydrogenase I [Bacteroidota bacterium]
MNVLKFGGTSMADAKAVRQVLSILEQKRHQGPVVVVPSAMGGVTDKLVGAAKAAAAGETTYSDTFAELETRHLDLIREVVPLQQQSEIISWFKQQLNQLEDVCRGVYLVRELTPKVQAWVLSYGERFSSRILHAALPEEWGRRRYWNSLELVVTDDQYLKAAVDRSETKSRLQKATQEGIDIAVMPGFVAATPAGEVTTLGRGGSDYTAALVAASLWADALEIWTDVDGMLTADPRLVSDARQMEKITYEEAMELAHFGAKVLYPPTLQPVLEEKIPMYIKNTFKPEGRGTLVHTEADRDHPITGLSAIKDIAMITVVGAGMVAVPGYARRVFAALSEAEVNVILITQASSEHSIGVAVDAADADAAERALEATFMEEISRGWVSQIRVEQELSVVAVVGENMQERAGLAGQTFAALGRNGVNVKAIAQGSSERNISLVVSQAMLRKALNVLHEEFFLSATRKVHLFMSGVGLVGSELLRQIAAQQTFLREEHATELVLVGVANSRKMLIDPVGIDPATAKERLDSEGVAADVAHFVEQMGEMNLRGSVWVDNTASSLVPQHYEDAFANKVSVVASNKIACSGSQAVYDALRQKALDNRVSFRYETNVGAGLPVMDQLRGLRQSGDRIRKIEAVLSGSLNYIFTSYDASRPLAEVVREAKEKGYTEPDPRDDLSGSDVGRKIIILAREAGYQLEPEEVALKSFLPDSVPAEGDVEEFFQALATAEPEFTQRYQEARAQDKRLRMIASLNEGKTQVALEAVGPDHPTYTLSGTDNLIMFYTERYGDLPLVVRGAGAGASVTAAGVFSDILRTQHYWD